MTPNEFLKLGLIEVKVHDLSSKQEVERFYTPCVPRVGEFFYVQYSSYEILEVRWWSINHTAGADIFIKIEEN